MDSKTEAIEGGRGTLEESVPEKPQPSTETLAINKNSSNVKSLKAANTTVGRFFSVSIVGALEVGDFKSVNDVYVKYSIVAGPDWIMTSGADVGVTQIARHKVDSNGERRFVWNQPINIAYRSYNYYGWPQIVLSVYNFDTFGNDQILGYGCLHLPMNSRFPSSHKHEVKIYSPQSSSFLKQVLSWVTRQKPELIDANLFARGDHRSVLQTIVVGKIQFTFNLTTKDVEKNGYRN